MAHPPSNRPSARSLLPLVGAAIALAVLALLALAPRAAAGTYRAAQCHDRLGAGRADAAFLATSPRYVRRADCSGRGLGVEHEAARRPTQAGRNGAWKLTAPAGTRIDRVSAGVAANGAGWHSPQLRLATADGAWRTIGGIRGPRHRVSASGNARALEGRLVCATSGSCGAGRQAHIHLRRIILTLRDSVAPRTALAGSMVEPGARRGVQRLRVRASDAGGGVRSVHVGANGRPVAGRTLDCALAGGFALRLRPCPRFADLSFDLTTTAAGFQQGTNRIRVCTADYEPQGRANSGCRSASVRVDNLCPVSASAAATLVAGLRRGGRVPSNQAALVRGRLTGRGGPIAGARVCIATTVRSQAQPERVAATPVTSLDGRFQARLPAGPSRAVRVAHWPDSSRALERFGALRSRVRPGLRLRPGRRLRNGERLRFRVRLPRPSNARRRVAIQARSDRGWVQIRRGRTDARGIWRAGYRFRSTTGTRRYAFRAFAPKQRGYPYEAGRSRVARRTVTG